MEASPIISRNLHLAEKVLFLDGISGTGKTMMGPILGSFERVEIGKFDHIHEHVCVLEHLGKMDLDAARALVGIYTDLSIYNLMISREVNFRFTDLSGVFGNPLPMRYLKRLFSKDGEAVMDRLKTENPILNIISHQALGTMKALFASLGDRLRVVEMVRHPVYLIEHWESVVDNFGTHARDFHICIEHQGKAIPWFVGPWANDYVKSSSIDKVIFILDHLFRSAQGFHDSLTAPQKEQVLWIPFEKFVLDTKPYIQKISDLIGSPATDLTFSTLKKQNCPRERILDGPAKAIYKRYRWSPPDKKKTDRQDLEEKKLRFEDMASPKARAILRELSSFYEEKYGLWY